jgi:hypothetical protein
MKRTPLEDQTILLTFRVRSLADKNRQAGSSFCGLHYDLIASDGTMTDELERICKEAVVI